LEENMTEQMTTTTYRTYLEELALSRGLSGAEELAERTHQAHPVYSAQQILECPPGGFGSALDDTIALSEEEAMARKIDSNWDRFLDLTLATPGFLAE
jgi:hypothetical protein